MSKESGDALVAKGDKQMKGGWFRRADPDAASQAYKDAANAYRAAGEWELCVGAYEKAAAAFAKNGVGFYAGEMLESAALIAKDKLQAAARAGDLYKRAARVFVENSNTQKACDVLRKGARALETAAPAEALDLCAAAIDVFREAERMIYTADVYKLAVAIALRQHLLADALEALRQWRAVALAIDRRSDTYKSGLALVVVDLARGDSVAAAKDFEQTCVLDTAFVQTPDGQAAARLLDAYDAGAPDDLDAAKRLQALDFLEPEVTKLARRLALDQTAVDASASAQSVFARAAAARAAEAAAPGAAAPVAGPVEAMAAADATMAPSTAANMQQRRVREERERMLLFATPAKTAPSKAVPEPEPEPEPQEPEPQQDTTTSTEEHQEEAGASASDAAKEEGGDEKKEEEQEEQEEQEEEEEDDDPYGLV